MRTRTPSGSAKRIDEFYASIQRRRPIEALGQKCGMDREDTIAVDLRDNVMTCQNAGAKGSHKIATSQTSTQSRSIP